MVKNLIGLFCGFLIIAFSVENGLSQGHLPTSNYQILLFLLLCNFHLFPSVKGWNGNRPLTDELEKKTIDNIINHGISILYPE
jgi:hypothetical protein